MEGKSVATQIETFDNLCKNVGTSGEKLYDAAVMSKLLSSLPYRSRHLPWHGNILDDKLIARNIREEKLKKICPL